MTSSDSAAPPTQSSDANGVGALSKALDVLEMVMNTEHPPSAARITEQLSLPRPTTNRIIGNLVRLNFLKRDPVLKQLIEGDRLLHLALSVIEHATQRGPRHELLRNLSERTGETCNIGTIAGGRIRYLDRVESHWPLALRLKAGSEIPLHCTALGKLLLAHLPSPQRDKYLRTLELTRYTDQTFTDRMKLKAELDHIVESGFSLDNEEYLPGVLGLAVPIPNGDSFPILALAVAAPSARLTSDQLREQLPLLRKYADKFALCS